MKKTISIILALCMMLSVFVFPAIGAGNSDSETTIYSQGREINFNKGWKFLLGNPEGCERVAFNDSDFTDVDIPHDFSIIQDFDESKEAESGYLPGGTGWYRKSFILNDTADKNTVISFDGVYSDAYVYVNGRYVGENHYGYNTFAFDITDYLNKDNEENIIAVKAVNNEATSRWYSGSGIYRDVTLYVTDKLHTALNGVFVTTPDIEKGAGTVSVSAEVINGYSESKEITIRNRVYEKDGTEILAEESHKLKISVGAKEKSISSLTVESPNLWDTENPNLYRVETSILLNGNEVDTITESFGFRYFKFDKDTGFSLNGKNVKLNGVCLHHDQGALGSAAYYDAMYRQISIMKEMGVNALRTSHNPADKNMIEICSELGVLVMDEAFDGWTNSKNGNSNDFSRYFNKEISSSNKIYGKEEGMKWCEYVMRATVRRDRNEPSVIMYSIGNEILTGCTLGDDITFPTIAQNLINAIFKEDTTRPPTMADNGSENGNRTLMAVSDVIRANGGVTGLNYSSTSEINAVRKAHPDWTLYGSETASAVNSRGVYVNQNNCRDSDGKYHLTSYDTSAVGWGHTAHDAIWFNNTDDAIAGQFVWTGFDYIGEPTPWNGTSGGSVSGKGAIPNSSFFGIVETTGFEKGSYWLYRSQWNQKADTLHLVTAWDSGNMYTVSGKTPVVIYSNAAKIELYRNGNLIGTSVRTVNETDAGHKYFTYTCKSENPDICTATTGSGSTSLYSTFNVAFEKGTISAKAFDEDGNEITSGCGGNSSVSTPDAVSKLNIYADKTEITADGYSLSYVTVDVTDERGNLDTKASNLIEFTLSGEGEIVGVDNGNQSTTEKFQQKSVLKSSKSAVIKAYAGKALVIIKSTDKAGEIKLTASSDGLSGADVTIKTVKTNMQNELKISYTKGYSVLIGESVTPEKNASIIHSDGAIENTQIEWESIDESIFNNEGNYSIKGRVTADGKTYVVTCSIIVDDPTEPTLWERIFSAFKKALSSFREFFEILINKIMGR